MYSFVYLSVINDQGWTEVTLRTTGRYLNTLVLVTLQVECPHRKTFNSALPTRQKKKYYIHENNN